MDSVGASVLSTPAKRNRVFTAILGALAAVIGVAFLALLISTWREWGRFDTALAEAHPVGVVSFVLACWVWWRVGSRSDRFSRAGRWTWKRVALACAGSIALGLSLPTALPYVTAGRALPGRHVFEVLAWVGLLPLLFAVRGLRPRSACWVGFVAGVVYFNVVFWWVNVAMTTFGGMPYYLSLPVLEILAAGCAEFWGFAAAIVAWATWQDRWPTWAVAPPAFAAAELTRNYFFTGFPWGSLGYTQPDNLWANQVASLGGVYLVAFAVVLVNALVFDAIRLRRSAARPRHALVLALSAIGVLVLTHAYGAVRVRWVDELVELAPKYRVALLQGNIDQKIKSYQQTHAEFVLDQYNPNTGAADDAGVDLVVWPEAAYPLYLRPDQKSFSGARLGRPRYGAHLLLGAGTADFSVRPYKLSNTAFLLAPDLAIVGRYDKHHLVPFGEYVMFNIDRWVPIGKLVPEIGFFSPGRELQILEAPPRGGPQPGRSSAKLAPLICYDAIFPEIGREFAERGANLLVNITNDAWYGFSSAPHQFLHIVAMRAIETRRAVARAANTGITAFVDPAGRIRGQTQLGMIDAKTRMVEASRHVPAVWIADEAPLMEGRTVYVVVGDLFAYLCMAWTLWLWTDGVLVSRRWRRAAGPKNGGTT